MKTVGIFVKKPESIFSNGCYQQSYFIFKMLNMIEGFICELITIEPEYKKFNDMFDTEVIYFDDITAKRYDCVLMLSLTIRDTNTLGLIKSNNIKLVDVLCGNLFILLQEEFVFKCHHIMKNYNNENIDEVWVLEMYEYSKEYLELLYNNPVRILPYVWDTDILKRYLHTSNTTIDIENVNAKKINICIYEPNMSIHKNAFIPLLIADKYYRSYPDRLNKIYIFCKGSLQNNGYIENMAIFKDKKIECHDRMIMPFTLKLIQENNPYKIIVLSYTHLNELNFLHLELLYMRIPIVHNCKPFQNDLYYENNNISAAINLLERARIQSINLERDINIICKYNTKKKSIQDKWRDEFMRIT